MPALNALLFVSREIRIVGSFTYGRPGPRADVDVVLHLLSEQPERFRQLITHRFPLDQIGSGFETAAGKSSGSIKAAIRPG